jgi:hypothetical protein
MMDLTHVSVLDTERTRREENQSPPSTTNFAGHSVRYE